MKWCKRKNKKTNNNSLTKNVKCNDCQNLFEPFDILGTKEGQFLYQNCFIKVEER